MARNSAQIRAATKRDFPSCARVCIRALRDLSRRQGKPPPHLVPPNFYPFFRYALTTDPDGFRVAVLEGRVVAYAITILREKTHFLAMFFALPGKQSQGIGRPLLARAFDDPRPPPGHARCVVASLDLRITTRRLLGQRSCVCPITRPGNDGHGSPHPRVRGAKIREDPRARERTGDGPAPS